MKFCQCESDGHCPRYNREMNGRMRQICSGQNVDLGTAAAFREQWRQEAAALPSRGSCGPPIPILLQTDQAPGDAVVSTAAIYSLRRAHPGKFVTAVESPYPEVFQYNPDVTNNLLTETVEEAFDFAQAHKLRMHYPAIHQSNQRGIHVMQAFCEHLGRSLAVEVPLLTNRPHLFFKEPAAPQVEDFWLICSGGKGDFTNKMWGHSSYQSLVDILRGYVRFVQVGGNDRDHPHLDGCSDRVGGTNLRQLFDLTRRARGVLCGVTLLMHVAAALDKPAVVVAGGREPVQWNAYPRQHYLHTVGSLPCTDREGRSGACWRSRTVPVEDSMVLDEYPCLYPVDRTPKCMTLITPEYVAETIMQVENGLTAIASCGTMKEHTTKTSTGAGRIGDGDELATA